MSPSRRQGPLTETEQKWRSSFDHKLKTLQGNAAFQTAFLDPIQLELADKLLKDTAILLHSLTGAIRGRKGFACAFFRRPNRDNSRRWPAFQ